MERANIILSNGNDMYDKPDDGTYDPELYYAAYNLTDYDLQTLNEIYPETVVPPATFENITDLLNTDTSQFTQTVHATRSDGFPLIYQGAHVAIYGEPGSGKTMLTKYIEHEAITQGHRVLHIDIDGNFNAVLVQDIQAFGAAGHDIIELFDLAQPSNITELIIAIEWARRNPYALIVIDSVASLQAFTSSDGDKSTDYVQRVYMAVIKPLLDTGATVITIDHTAKGDHIRGAAGTVQKRAKADLAFHIVAGPDGLARGRDGRIRLYLDKDRYSTVKAASAQHDDRDLAALFKIPKEGMLYAKLDNPSNTVNPITDPPRSTRTSETILEFLADGKGHYRLDIIQHVGKTADACNRALKRLIMDKKIYKSDHDTFTRRLDNVGNGNTIKT